MTAIKHIAVQTVSLALAMVITASLYEFVDKKLADWKR